MTASLDRAVDAFDAYFRSGNDVPIERAVIPTAEWHAIRDALAALPHLSPGVELRALVEKWRRASSGCFNDRANAVSRCADELAAIIDNKQESA